MGAAQNFDWQGAAASAVEWWIDAGVDASVDEAPRDWLTKSAPPAAQPAAAAAVAAPPPALPDTLEAFLAWRAGEEAPEAAWPGRTIGAQGDPAAPLAILIDQPEREDADSGVLMSGAPGVLFDRMLAAIGQDRGSIYLVPLALRRPPAGRIAPEIEARLGELARHHVALAAPRRLLALGNAASRAITGADVAPARGSLHAVNLASGTVTATIGAVASFHPRFLIERPPQKAEAWKDLLMLIGGLGK